VLCDWEEGKDGGQGGKRGVVEARSGGSEGTEGEGLFEVLRTRWSLEEEVRKEGEGEDVSTVVDLGISVKFRSAMYDMMLGSVEDRVAGMMMAAFERRVKEEVGKGA